MRHPRLPVLTIFLFITTTALADAPTTQPTRAAFLKLIDRPRIDLSSREHSSPQGALLETSFSYASDPANRVPGILLKSPGDDRRPAVIVAHGTGGKKESELPTMKQLVAKGFIAVAIDARYHGERGNQSDYNAAIARAFESGNGAKSGAEHPLYWDTVWDLTRLIDYLQTRPDIDPHRIGLIGFSKGGIETYFAAAADDRIACAVPCIGVQSFRWALDHDQWHGRVGTIRKAFDAAAQSAGVEKPGADFVHKFYEHVVPGIDADFDGPAMLPLIAPRPLLIINGDKDDKTPLDGVNLAADAARAAYHVAHADDHFKQIVEPNTGHAVTKEAQQAAIEWLVKWLKP